MTPKAFLVLSDKQASSYSFYILFCTGRKKLGLDMRCFFVKGLFWNRFDTRTHLYPLCCTSSFSKKKLYLESNKPPFFNVTVYLKTFQTSKDLALFILKLSCIFQQRPCSPNADQTSGCTLTAHPLPKPHCCFIHQIPCFLTEAGR